METNKKTILIIEDEKAINKIIAHNLKINGFNVLSASNGEEGLKLFEKEKPDLILLDIMMPVMDGNTFCKELRHRYPNDKTPIIIMTAKHDNTQVLESFKYGAVDFIDKPFTIDFLIDEIKKHLENKIDDTDFIDYHFF